MILGSADLNVWQFDEKKSLAYLENKVKRVAKQLAIMRTDKSSELPNGIRSFVFLYQQILILSLSYLYFKFSFLCWIILNWDWVNLIPI